MFSRTIWGARVSLTVGFAAITFGMLIGGSLGILAGYFRGWWDRIVSFVFLVLLSFPALVLAILITTLIDRSLFTISATLGFPGDRAGRAPVRGPRRSSSASASSWSPHAPSGPRTGASSFASCCPTW